MEARPAVDNRAAQAQLKLLRLRQQFRAGLAGRARELLGAASAPELHGVVHRLAGAAGSYGEDALALQARLTLNLLHEAAGPPVTPQAHQAVGVLCALCEALARDATATSPPLP